jgi:hypothetical protein
VRYMPNAQGTEVPSSRHLSGAAPVKYDKSSTLFHSTRDSSLFNNQPRGVSDPHTRYLIHCLVNVEKFGEVFCDAPPMRATVWAYLDRSREPCGSW